MPEAKDLPKLWKLEAHTVAKHRILKGYLDAWFPILSRHPKADRVLYIDAFAGPGEYEDGEDGSPIIALNSALQHSQTFQSPVHMVFVEADRERCDHLKEVLERRHEDIARTNKRIEIKGPYCRISEELLSETLAKYEHQKKRFGPALVFLDQFGYSDVPLGLIEKIMRHERCEVFSYLNGDGIRRFVGDPSKHDAISRAYGGDSWKVVLRQPRHQHVTLLANEYKRVLKDVAKVKYVWNFAMHGDGNKLLYWLFFCTNHIRGLEEMKRSMARVDVSGGSFQFSDVANPSQTLLFDQFSDAWLEHHLSKRFAGETLSVGQVGEHVLEHTPGISFKTSLRTLESNGTISVPSPLPGRRKGTFKDDAMKIAFRVADATTGKAG